MLFCRTRKNAKFRAGFHAAGVPMGIVGASAPSTAYGGPLPHLTTGEERNVARYYFPPPSRSDGGGGPP
jgi:hypothetical protein